MPKELGRFDAFRFDFRYSSLKSPTTHPSDKVIAPELAELVGVNLEEYGLAMLKAGTNLASKSAEELIDIEAGARKTT